MTADELRMAESLVNLPTFNGPNDQRIIDQFRRVIRRAGAPWISEGQAGILRALVSTYRTQPARDVTALAQ